MTGISRLVFSDVVVQTATAYAASKRRRRIWLAMAINTRPVHKADITEPSHVLGRAFSNTQLKLSHGSASASITLIKLDDVPTLNPDAHTDGKMVITP